MQLPLLASTFITVFLAELGDKTQLAIVTISGTSNRTGAVFAGSATALVLASLLGAGAGGSLSAVIPTNALQLAASLGFLVIGTRLLLRAGSEADATSKPSTEAGAAGETEAEGEAK
ncbi:MAG: UPF0016 domain-containing protein [Cyanobacteria bacterium M_surface_10_m1_298]|nr:UPF0016 domain-containing protein [Cyanobacteria bacterium M_surface_10_m1_298]